mmetsp:Transcript_1167/g.2869  ORF Transcript_1167/g.2869 Transcript_1167/m.2869 type:complete len:226 (-) Transcript_1167:350-1027(-)
MQPRINYPAEWIDAEGELTIEKRSSKQLPMKFYGSWFCPFVQRPWIALEEKGVDYQWVEINPYEVDPKELGGYTKKALSVEEKGKKYPEFIKTVPNGLIPGIDNGGERVFDSLYLMEYIDEAFDGPRYMPKGALQKWRQRYWSRFIDDQLQRNYYAMLMAQDPTAQEDYRQRFYQACRQFAREMEPISEGPFFSRQRLFHGGHVLSAFLAADPLGGHTLPWPDLP